MQSVSSATRQAMESQTVKAFPEAVFEFNHTLLSDVTVSSPDGKDELLFPRDSVAEQRYIDSGIPRAIVGQSEVFDRSYPIHYRAVSEQDVYKQWVSSRLSSSGGNITDAWMEVVYDRNRPTNKIQVIFDVTWARPTSVNVDIRVGSGWSRIATNIEPDDNTGRLELYPAASGWSTTPSAPVVQSAKNVRGVRVTVNRMNRSGVYAQFVAISAHLRVDMTEKITNFDVNKNLDNATVLAPIGDSSSQSLSISLENEDGELDPENQSTLYYDLLTRNVKIEASIKVENTPSIPQGTFFAEGWDYSAPGVEIGLSGTDMTRFMQEMYLSQFVLIDYTVRDAVRDILARSGFKADQFMIASNPVVPYIWYNEDVTVWQALKDIANATLAYFFVDERGRFVWIDFETLGKRNSSLTLDAGSNLVDLDHNFDVIANDITVSYNTYGTPVDEVTKEPVTQEIWSPGEDVALLSMPLKSNVSMNATSLTLDADAASMDLWPDEGIIALGGEYMRYTGKNKNARQLTGLERGIFGSRRFIHTASSLGIGHQMGTTAGRRAIVEGHLRMTSPASTPRAGYNYALIGPVNDRRTVYGTRLRFPQQSTHESAGLFIHHTGGYSGVYVEICSTRYATANNHDEILVYRRNADNSSRPTFATSPYEVARNNWYDIEITVEYTQPIPVFSVYVNGMFVHSFADDVQTRGQWGTFVRGHTVADFSRIYAATTPNDKIGGTRYSGEVADAAYQSDFMYNSGDPNVYINEFATQVRQVMDFDVDFSKYPVTSSSVFNSNRWQARVFKYIPGPFGASFYLENKSDMTAVVNGESPNLFPDPMQMTMIIVGDPVIVKSEEKESLRDRRSIRRNGRVELEVSNPWIQTKEMASRISKLILDNFGEPMDTITTSVFPNYALQIGDVIEVEYPEHGYNKFTHKYYVLSIGTAWGNGFSQNLTLRRKR